MYERPAVDYFSRHRDQPALLLGNGPSLNQLKDITVPEHFITIGMNKSWKLIPVTDYHCIMFHHEHLDDLKKYKYLAPNTTLWTYRDYSEMWVREVDEGDVVYVPSVASPDNEMHNYNIAGLISTDLSDCSYADMTGMFALEVALWLRCNPVYLIGYDLYGGHFYDKVKPEADWQEVQVELFDMTAEQIDNEVSWVAVYNLNPESRISGFERQKLAAALG